MTYLPVMEHRHTEGLSLGMCSQVCLESKRIDGWNKRLDSVQGGAWHWCVLSHVTSVVEDTNISKTDEKDSEFIT